MNLRQYVIKVSITIMLTVIPCVLLKDISERTNLSAVTNFEKIDEFHYNFYVKTEAGTKPHEPSDQKARAIHRQEMCTEIFSSPLFEKHHQVKTIHEGESMAYVTELHENHRSLFDYIFHKSEGFVGMYQYANRFEPHSFLFNGEQRSDYMCFCLGRKIDETGGIEAYLVSREYNVNMVPEGHKIAGRFVFAYDLPNSRVEMLAEEPAVESKAKVVEYHYIKQRQNNVELGLKEMDPICKLTPSSKIRLCASIFASKLLRQRFKFMPSLEHVGEECQRNRVSFTRKKRLQILARLKHRHFRRQGNYEEWMISCDVEDIGSASTITYYVSRGDVKNTAFAYTYDTNGEMMVAHYFRNVSVVDSIETNESSSSYVGTSDNETNVDEGGTDDDRNPSTDGDYDGEDEFRSEVPLMSRRRNSLLQLMNAEDQEDLPTKTQTRNL